MAPVERLVVVGMDVVVDVVVEVVVVIGFEEVIVRTEVTLDPVPVDIYIIIIS